MGFDAVYLHKRDCLSESKEKTIAKEAIEVTRFLLDEKRSRGYEAFGERKFRQDIRGRSFCGYLPQHFSALAWLLWIVLSVFGLGRMYRNSDPS
jgi:hypothetical protein